MKSLFLVLASLFFFSSPSFALNNLETCFSPKGNCDQKIISYLDGAQKTIDMAIYSLTLQGIRDALLRAQQRGVKIRVVCDRSGAQGTTSVVPQLVLSGIDLKVGNAEGLMHNKFTLVDGLWLETGSYNYSFYATAKNAENQIYLNEAGVLAAYQENFEDLWSNGLPFVASTQQPGTTPPKGGATPKPGGSPPPSCTPGQN